ncbi:hypothetical protein [Arthrobacter sp. FW306-2-2C-D06B]|uniref:hypothetical protein n=1 Tax=Arthrobacter sp. FW306-2-2C-D06B TaxID=2879618 RepID=UPI001F35F2DB|nr:hypothetical protein [Arthrobacter sp. FW306-2-2C-D06B]UKA60623.1 hypothetical protein LFT47_09970 [Arthrobacter sp. FW306-2-2C-D06B]
MSTKEQNTGWTGGKNAFGDFAPGMVHYTSDERIEGHHRGRELSIFSLSSRRSGRQEGH